MRTSWLKRQKTEHILQISAMQDIGNDPILSKISNYIYQGDKVMETINGYAISGEWKNSTCGKIAIGERGGKKFFIKRYQTPVEPIDNGALDARTMTVNREKFDKHVALRKKVNNALRSVAGAGGNIVAPVDEFVYDHHYHEVSEFIEGVVPEKEIESTFAGLSPDQKKLVLVTAAGALISIHKLGMIHSDLKIKNILMARSRSGSFVTKVIDFDNTYFEGELPDEVVGDINYYSPELGEFSTMDEEDREGASGLTTKSDIFSLGLIFHQYLTGEFPQAVSLTPNLQKRKDKGKAIYVWTILNSGCELKVSPMITDANQAALIADMLKKDPAQRPDATEVWQRLKGVGARTSASTGGASGTFARPSATPSARSTYGSTIPRPTPSPRPATTTSTPIPSTVVIDEPWPEDAIVFDKEKIRNSGYASVKRVTQSGVNGYKLSLSDGRGIFMNKNTLISRKYATTASAGAAPTPPPTAVTGFCEPWPEHGIVFNEDAIRARGYVSSERCEMYGIKGYNFYRADGRKDFVKENLAVMFRMATKV